MKKIAFLISAVIVIFVSSAAFGSIAETEGPVRLGVMKFTSKSEGITDQQAAAIGDIFTRALANTDAMIIVERERIDDIAKEHHLAQSGLADDNYAVKIGKIISCRYMLMGAVTGLETKTSKFDVYFTSDTSKEVSVTVDVRVVDVETSRIIMTFSEEGRVSRKGKGFNIYGIKIEDGKEFEGIEEAAIAEAVLRASFNVREGLAGERVQVIKVTAKEITLSAGVNWGINEDVLFGIYSEGEEVKNLDGTSMGRKLTLLAVVKVKDVQKEFCYAGIMKNCGKASDIRKGNIAKPITQKDVNDLIRRKYFSKKK